MARNFKELDAKMPPESLGRAKVRAKEMIAEMLLSELRQVTGLTQEEVAASLGIKQPTLSRMESQDDIQVSTLERLVRALGGELEIIAHLPGREVRIRQFKESTYRTMVMSVRLTKPGSGLRIVLCLPYST
jgi:plasmid maintenance system antidote protein VapI